MRTESVDSRITKILEKALQAKQHLDEAMAEADTLPAEESREVRKLLAPAENHLRAGVGSLRTYLETPPA